MIRIFELRDIFDYYSQKQRSTLEIQSAIPKKYRERRKFSDYHKTPIKNPKVNYMTFYVWKSLMPSGSLSD